MRKISVTRSSLLTTIVIVVLLAALPFAVWELWQTGELYVLSRRFVDDMMARLSGPGRMRFIFQPTAAIILGTRDGLKDARAGAPPFLSGLLFHPTKRPGLFAARLYRSATWLPSRYCWMSSPRFSFSGWCIRTPPCCWDRC